MGFDTKHSPPHAIHERKTQAWVLGNKIEVAWVFPISLNLIYVLDIATRASHINDMAQKSTCAVEEIYMDQNNIFEGGGGVEGEETGGRNMRGGKYIYSSLICMDIGQNAKIMGC